MRYMPGIVTIMSLIMMVRPATAQAPVPDPSLKGVTIKLGMPESDARRVLADRFDVRNVPDTRDVVLISERSDGQAVGSVNFTGGRVVMVTENWPIPVATEEAIGNVFFQILQRLTQREESGWRLASNCDVGTMRGDGPALEVQLMEMQCGLRTMSLTIQRDPQGRGRLIALRTGSIPRSR